MAKVNNVQTMLQNVATWEDARRYVSEALTSILTQFNGKIDFGDNIRSAGPITVSFPNSSAVLAVSHSLGRIPTGYIILTQSAAGNVLVPAGANYAWTSSFMFLQASAAMNVTFYAV